MSNYTIYTQNITMAMKSVINGWGRHHTGETRTCIQILSETPEEKRPVRKWLHRQKAKKKWIVKNEGVRVQNGLTCLTLGTNEKGYYEQGNKRL